jgi:predicted nucleic acid-binding protein
MSNSKLIYLDVCVLCRPFDNQQYLRIKMEMEAVNLILSNVKKGKYKLIVSPVHLVEIDAIPDIYERIQLKTILDRFGVPTSVNISKTRERAEELFQKGFGVADAAHIAFAEKSNASFVTCDDRLLKKCLNDKISIWCTNPVIFCEKEELR